MQDVYLYFYNVVFLPLVVDKEGVGYYLCRRSKLLDFDRPLSLKMVYHYAVLNHDLYVLHNNVPHWLTKCWLAVKLGRSLGSCQYIIKKIGCRHSSLACCAQNEPLFFISIQYSIVNNVLCAKYFICL